MDRAVAADHEGAVVDREDNILLVEGEIHISEGKPCRGEWVADGEMDGFNGGGRGWS